MWGVTRDGRAVVRLGITHSNAAGVQWADVDAPGVPLKKVQVGGGAVWAIDSEGTLYQRTETQPLFPEGTGWSEV